MATKSKPKPRFSEEDRKKARERLKRLEQEAHDAKLAAELQRKQFDKDFGDNSDDDDRRPNPSASGSGIPKDSQGRAIEPDRRKKVKVATRATGPGEAPKKGKTQGAGEARAASNTPARAQAQEGRRQGPREGQRVQR